MFPLIFAEVGAWVSDDRRNGERDSIDRVGEALTLMDGSSCSEYYTTVEVAQNNVFRR